MQADSLPGVEPAGAAQSGQGTEMERSSADAMKRLETPYSVA